MLRRHSARHRNLLLATALVVGAAIVVRAWSLRIQQTPITSAEDVNRVVIRKSAHTLTLLHDGHVLGTYRVALARGGPGPKQQEGDNKVPEGQFRIVEHKPDSAYHRALRLNYPTPLQAADASRRGLAPGGDIMIHGLPNGLG